MVHEHYTGMVGKVMGISENPGSCCIWRWIPGQARNDWAEKRTNDGAGEWANDAHPAWLAKFVEKLGAKIAL